MRSHIMPFKKKKKKVWHCSKDKMNSPVLNKMSLNGLVVARSVNYQECSVCLLFLKTTLVINYAINFHILRKQAGYSKYPLYTALVML